MKTDPTTGPRDRQQPRLNLGSKVVTGPTAALMVDDRLSLPSHPGPRRHRVRRRCSAGGSRRRVFELLRAQGVDLLALLRGRIVDREDLDSLADVRVERLRGTLVDVNLVPVFEAQDDVRIVVVRVLLADLLSFWGHRAWCSVRVIGNGES